MVTKTGCNWWNAALVCWPGRQGGVQAALPHTHPLRPPAPPQDGQHQAPDHPVHSSHTAQEFSLWLCVPHPVISAQQCCSCSAAKCPSAQQ
jgi:hypothetical protein